MVMIYSYFESMSILLFVLFFVLLFVSSKICSNLVWNLPIIGMLPTLACNLHRHLDMMTEVLERSGGTFPAKGPWFANMDFLFTSDPANVYHIMSSNFSKYSKGIEWKKRFDVFGDCLLNSDNDQWKYHRALVKGFLNHQSLHELMPKIFADSMEKELVPFLENASKQDEPVALQHLLGKHIFYITCRLSFGNIDDLGSFQTGDSHQNLFSKAMEDAWEAIFFRFVQPESIWRLQNWVGVGKEKRLSKASITLHHIISESAKEENLRKEDMDFCFSKLLSLRDDLVGPSLTIDKATRSIMLNFMLAVRDTISTTLVWFFWLLTKHPFVERRIREELKEYFPENGETKWPLEFDAKELKKMVYLHAALCESLRLYPPVPFQSRSVLDNDTLPSGHKLKQGTRIVISTYAMGRMTSIWGDDCLEFKPERWITDDGGIKHEPAHKFFAFNSGPRTCVGKDFAFNWMKAITSTIIHDYDIRAVENCQIKPKSSIMLDMNHDLMVTLKKRWA